MKNIHILPTDKPSRLLFLIDKGFVLTSYPYTNNSTHNIFITSDEEIKKGDWFFRNGSIHKCFKVHKTDIEFLTSVDSVYCGSNTFWEKMYCKKIILTTDPDLIKDGVQEIPDEFLEWFVKNPSCEEVEIKLSLDYKLDKFGNAFWGYDIIIPKEIDVLELGQIIPKEEPKQETVYNKLDILKDLHSLQSKFHHVHKYYSLSDKELTKNNFDDIIEDLIKYIQIYV